MKRKRCLSVTLVIIYSVMCAAFVFSGGQKDAGEVGWPQWRGPNGTAVVPDTDWDPQALAGGPKILWKTNIGSGYSNVVLRDDRLYAFGRTSDGAVVSCLSASTGEVIWTFVYDTVHSPQATPVIDGEYVYALGNDGVLFCLKAKNGKLRWQTDLVSKHDVKIPSYRFAASPIVAGELILLNINLSGIAINKSNGELVWTSDKYHPTNSELCPEGEDTGGYATPVLYEQEGI